jgi:hypothetical protein
MIADKITGPLKGLGYLIAGFLWAGVLSYARTAMYFAHHSETDMSFNESVLVGWGVFLLYPVLMVVSVALWNRSVRREARWFWWLSVAMTPIQLYLETFTRPSGWILLCALAGTVAITATTGRLALRRPSPSVVS